MPTEKKTRPKTARKQKPVVQLTYQGLCGWLVLYLLAVIWIFILGVMVGRGSAPVSFDIDQLEKELEVLRQTVLEKQQEEMKRDSELLADKTDFDFYDDLKKNKNEVDFRIQKMPENKPPMRRKTSLKAETKGNIKSNPKAKATEPAKKTEAAPLPGKYTIQYAATRDVKAADRLVDDLKRKGFSAYKVSIQDSKKNDLYRIRVGYFDNAGQAEKVLGKLKKMKHDAILIAK